jgi:3',5'-cyclic AMP phosphodiesterase CpdA
MAEKDGGVDRRQALECMIWAGTGVLWTLAGGVPKSALLGSAQAAEGGFSFPQISDSHVGFDKAANPDAFGTLREAIGKVVAMPAKVAFMIHTGDITHLSRPRQFDDADQVIGEARLDVHYVPGEHDVIDETQGRAYLDRYGRNAKGAGWYSFDQGGVHFIGLVNVVDLKAGGMGNLGPAQLAWLADDLAGKSASTPSAPRSAAPPPPSARKRRSHEGGAIASRAWRHAANRSVSARARRAGRSALP